MLKKTMMLGMIFVLALFFGLVNYSLAEEKGLVGYWKFDEGKGDIAKDATNNENNGKVYGAATWTEGKLGSALKFDGSSDYVDCGSGDSLGITDAITIEAWVKPNLLGTWGHIAGKYESETDNQAYLLYKTKWGDKVRFLLSPQGDGTDMLYFDSDTSLTLDTWCHVVGVLDNANNMAYIYLNGREDKSAAYNYDIFDSDIPLLVGNFPGAIDEVRIYNRALTATEVENHYKSGRDSSVF